jgi:protein kinase A
METKFNFEGHLRQAKIYFQQKWTKSLKWQNSTDNGDGENGCIENYVVKDTIGSGSFGEVSLVEDKITKNQFALKKIKTENISASSSTELRLLASLDFPFVVRLEDHFTVPGGLCLVMELLPGGELFHLLRQVGAMREEQARFYVAQVVLSLEYLHSLDIIYRDLKSENLLLDSAGYIKLIDFGLARVGPGRARTLCGTPDYLAPEVVLGRGYGAAVDWWALGVLAWELGAGDVPWTTVSTDQRRPLEVFEAVLAGPGPCPASFSPGLARLVAGLLERRPEARLGPGLRAEPWLARLDWAALWGRQLPAPYLPMGGPGAGGAREYCWNREAATIGHQLKGF